MLHADERIACGQCAPAYRSSVAVLEIIDPLQGQVLLHGFTSMYMSDFAAADECIGDRPARVSPKGAGRPGDAWQSIVAPYQQPSTTRALWQLVDTLGPYALVWYAIFHAVQISLWAAVPLALLSGSLLVRIFILFHDCAHGSYFRSRRANEIVGRVLGVLTFTPYSHWRREHAMHHSSAGNLDRRGTGDVWTMTVQEYLAASPGRRLAYRLIRNPFVLFVVAPFFVFVIKQRFAFAKADRRQRRSIAMTNLALLGSATLFMWVVGIGPYLLVQAIAMTVAGAAGLWLFYVQHQFEGVYWERDECWEQTAAALRGSSFYKLPRILQWFSGNIGFHHVHHLSPRIPNYHLQRCHESDRLFQQVRPVTLGAGWRSLTFRFWDEQGRRLVGNSHMRRLRKEQRCCAPASRVPD
jgi:omega-6 fatty acid desaturase (delta-12 desaturase)